MLQQVHSNTGKHSRADLIAPAQTQSPKLIRYTHKFACPARLIYMYGTLPCTAASQCMAQVCTDAQQRSSAPRLLTGSAGTCWLAAQVLQQQCVS